MHWDIFCDVVDNYGDIGVTWRLAKQLSGEFEIPIRLWVNDLETFQVILPSIELISKQEHQGVTILDWKNLTDIDWASGLVLIEAFGCRLPNAVMDRLPLLERAPIWINLEYLSAEAWIEGCHQLPSLQLNQVKKYFFFPGFTKESGGLIREASLFHQRDLWKKDPNNRAQLFKRLTGVECASDALLISYFSYDDRFLNQILESNLKKIDNNIHLLIPSRDNPFNHSSINHMMIHQIPFSTQEGYDQLLWSCDFNIVRGEDSFVRAQWAGVPFLWHIYPQQEAVHLVKLTAFMNRYCETLEPELAQPLQHLSSYLNDSTVDESIENINLLWLKLLEQRDKLTNHAENWSNNVLNDTDLATRLVKFVKSR